MIMRCGHPIHGKCFTQYSRTNIACPTCRKSICDPRDFEADFDAQYASQPIPEEFKEKKITVQCNDCGKKSEVAFHFFGGKCQEEECRSWNTQQV